MKYVNNYMSNVEGQTFCFVNLADFGIDKKDLLSKFKPFVEFMERFHCSIDELCEQIDKLCILDKDLFEFTAYNFADSVLVAKNGISVEVREKTRYGGYKTKMEPRDVFVCANTYVCLHLTEIAKELFKKRFKFLTEQPFVRREKRFNDNINDLPKIGAQVNDIDTWVLINNNITIEELIKLYTDPGYKDSYIDKPIWNIYSNYNNIYFNVNEKSDGNTVTVPIEALFNKDWSAVENVKVFSVCLYDENGNRIPKKWYEGLQKDAPYMNSEVAKALQKVFWRE